MENENNIDSTVKNVINKLETLKARMIEEGNTDLEDKFTKDIDIISQYSSSNPPDQTTKSKMTEFLKKTNEVNMASYKEISKDELEL